MNKILNHSIVAGLFISLLTPLVVFHSLFFPYITSKAFFFRIITELIFVLWLVLAWRVPNYRPRKSWISLSLLVFTGVAILATIFGENPYHSFWSNFERMDGLLSYLHLLAYFFVISSVLKTEKIWQYFWHSSVGISLIVGVYSLLQIIGVLPISQGRLDATLGNAIYLAVFMFFHIFITMFLLAKNSRITWTRYVYLPIILFQIFILYKTATRGAILGLLAGLFVFGLILLIKKWPDFKVRRISLVVLLALVLVVAGFWLGRNSSFVLNSPVLSRFADISRTEVTTESRLTIWQMSLKGFKEKPLLGWGPENYMLVFNKFYEPKLWRQEPWFDRSHNIFLDWLIGAGLFGLLAYLGVFVAIIYYLWRRESDTYSVTSKAIFSGLLIGYLVNNIFAFDNLTSYLLLVIFLAYLHQHHITDNSSMVSFPVLNNNRAIVGVMLVVAIVGGVSALYYFNFRPLVVSRQIIKAISDAPNSTESNEAVRNKLALFDKIFSQNTFGSREATEQFALQSVQIANSQAISDEIKQEVANTVVLRLQAEVNKTPEDVRASLILGSLLQRFGRPAEAVTVLSRALTFSPRKQAVLFQLASAYLESGNKGRALITARQAFELDQNFPEARKFYALVLIHNNKTVEAEKILAEVDNLELDERFINAYVLAERYDLVLKLWQDRVKKNPVDTQSRFSLAAAYLANGQRNLAIQELEAAAEIEPGLRSQVTNLINEIRAGRNPTTQ